MIATPRATARRASGVNGFTLVELLVVIGIIALLMSILLPTLGRVRERAAAINCMSNLRQWGNAMLIYANQNGGLLPFDGGDGTAGDPIGDWNDRGLWINALPQLVGVQPYGEYTGGVMPPGPGEKTMFACPSVDMVGGVGSDSLVNGMYYNITGRVGGATSVRPVFVCYVINSKLLQSGDKGRKLTSLRPTSSWIVMVEKRMTPGELPTTDAHYNSTLARVKADRKRFAARHNKGGNLLFADGHVDHAFNTEVNTRNPNAANLDYNYPDRWMWAWGRAAD
jgi:prepilin-type processing-associated H-X9-DG protein/prepilin-type N-terminal cleavage/methylation domain-containing protein